MTTRKSVGRNDPCRCGSGRKYKVCCMKASERISKTNAMISIAYHADANPEKIDQLVNKHARTLLAAVANNKKSYTASGCAYLQIEEFYLAAYDRESAGGHGFDMEPDATFLVLGMPVDCQLADSIRAELAADKGLKQIDPETFAPKHDGEFVDFEGKRGFFKSDRVPFFRLRRQRFGTSDHEDGPGWIQSAFFSGAGRTVHVWKMFRDIGDERPLCVEIYEGEIHNDLGLDELETMDLSWELEFNCEWPKTIALPELGVTACIIDDPNQLEIPPPPN